MKVLERIGKNKIRALVEPRSIGENKNLDSGAVKNHTHTHTHACTHTHTSLSAPIMPFLERIST